MNLSPESSTPTPAPGSGHQPALSASPSLGPDLRPLGGFRRRRFIFAFAWRRHRLQIITMGFATLALLWGVLAWDVLRPPIPYPSPGVAVAPTNWADWVSRLQSLLGVGTLLVALFVWYGEIRDDWENDLPRRMSVFFFHAERPVIVCRHVWLAGADDLRAWGQQVAAQAAGERFLDFSPEIEARGPELRTTPGGTVCRHYAVCFRLTRLSPALSSHPLICRYQNLVAADTAVRDEPVEAVAALPEVGAWQRAPRSSL